MVDVDGEADPLEGSEDEFDTGVCGTGLDSDHPRARDADGLGKLSLGEALSKAGVSKNGSHVVGVPYAHSAMLTIAYI